ncbi:MAG: DUF4369 domain-containing protein [Bacteroides sp.]
MKKYILFLQAVVLVLLASACSSTPGYTIQGIATNPAFEGKTVYLKDAYNNQIVYDSVTVKGGKFQFADTTAISEPYVRVLSLHLSEGGLDYRLPVIFENGSIEATLGDIVGVVGTKTNDKLQDFLRAVDEYSATCTNKSVEDIKTGFADLLKQHILDNSDNQVGVYIFKSYPSALTDALKQSIKKEAGEWFNKQVE